MRHRSPTNSKPGKNLPLRQEYLATNGFCELSPWLSVNVPYLGLDKIETASEVHHVFGGPRRWDVLTNMIAVCRAAHDWCSLDMTDQRVLCLDVKRQKQELSLEEFYDMTGMYLEGWLLNHVPTHPALLACHAELTAFSVNQVEA